jgi:uncharacterized membrane protein YwaF
MVNAVKMFLLCKMSKIFCIAEVAFVFEQDSVKTEVAWLKLQLHIRQVLGSNLVCASYSTGSGFKSCLADLPFQIKS